MTACLRAASALMSVSVDEPVALAASGWCYMQRKEWLRAAHAFATVAANAQHGRALSGTHPQPRQLPVQYHNVPPRLEQRCIELGRRCRLETAAAADHAAGGLGGATPATPATLATTDHVPGGGCGGGSGKYPSTPHLPSSPGG